MCQFHSFLWQCESGEIFDQPGEVHHSAIAVGCGVDQDRFLLPEFRLAERQLDFDGKGWADVYGTHPGEGDDFLFDRHVQWTNKGLDKLNRYLVKHFGTADALMEFVEPQWEQAQRSCIETLKKGVWVPAEPQKSGLPELRLDEGMRDWNVNQRRDMIDVTVSASPYRQFTQGQMHLEIQCSEKAIPTTPDAILEEGFELVIYAASQIIRTGKLLAEAIEFLGNGLVRLAASEAYPSVIAPRIEFDEWKQLFREARNRVECWQEDRVEMLV